jgi:drug/metabolite transporter (DMT)-like permease
MFNTYNAQVKNILSDQNPNTNWSQVLDHHRLMLSRIQHERLIHLLVTIFVGLVMSAALFTALIAQLAKLLLYTSPLLVLFIAYLFHYRFLENTTQSWYKIEDDIISRQ